ncbi:MAG: hypothetical protein AAF798_10020 [Bacteroidota bacterium]
MAIGIITPANNESPNELQSKFLELSSVEVPDDLAGSFFYNGDLLKVSQQTLNDTQIGMSHKGIQIKYGQLYYRVVNQDGSLGEVEFQEALIAFSVLKIESARPTVLQDQSGKIVALSCPRYIKEDLTIQII